MGRQQRSGARRRDLGTWFFILLFPAIFIPAGMTCLVIGARQTVESIQSPAWPRAEGKVVYVGRRSQSVDVRVIYDYAVNGKPYRAQRHDFASSYAHPSHEYSVGKSVTVFHHPADPTNAVLAPGFRIGPVLFALFGAAAVVVGAAIGRFLYNGS